jgi:hypothetical protein
MRSSVRQLDAVASRSLTGLTQRSRVLPGLAGPMLLDVDDPIIQVHGYDKQGAGFGYSEVCGVNMLLATVSTASAAPVVVAQRLRKSRAPHLAARNGWSPTRSRPCTHFALLS